MSEETTTTQNPHTVAAQARVEEIRAMRQLIPYFVFPTSRTDRLRLIKAASVPHDFVELAAVAIKNTVALVRGESPDGVQLRDLMSFADAYGPYADELEALARFVRHSVTAARNRPAARR